MGYVIINKKKPQGDNHFSISVILVYFYVFNFIVRLLAFMQTVDPKGYRLLAARYMKDSFYWVSSR